MCANHGQRVSGSTKNYFFSTGRQSTAFLKPLPASHLGREVAFKGITPILLLPWLNPAD